MDTKYLLPAYYEAAPALKDVFEGIFPIGTCVSFNEIEEGSVTYNTVRKHFNVFTAGNEMKPLYLNPREGRFEFGEADAFVDFAEGADAIVRGHTLVWHSQVPDWWFRGSGENGAATSDELMARMKEYISTVVGRYKGRVNVWDVVNEVISDSTGDIRRNMDNSKWAEIVGDLDGDGKDTDYIEQAFILAHEADPDAELIINDYNIEQSPQKLNAFYDLCKSMLEKGIPVDGAGIQGHIQLGWPPVETFEASIEKLATLREYNPDFKIQVTELDVSIFDWNDKSLTKEITPQLQKQLAERYADLFEMFRRQAEKGNLEMVILWGYSDGMTWLDNYPVPGRTDAPLIFDREMLLKPAFWGVVDRDQIDAAIDELPKE